MNRTVDATAKEQLLFAAFEAIDAPLALIDRDGGLLLANPTFRDRFDAAGLTTADLAAAAIDAGPVWKSVNLVGKGPDSTPVPVYVIAAQGRILVAVQENEDPETSGKVADLRRRISDLELLASTDYLTGAWNRSHFDRNVTVEIERSLSHRQPVSLILFDVDNFKAVNDRLGHARGDTVLRELVTLVRSRVRASDMVFRWGGEEFAILMASIGHRHCRTAAEALRAAVAAHSFSDVGHITVSVGVAEYDGDATPMAWFDRADGALRRAKKDGRDRVVVAEGGNSDRWADSPAPGALHLLWSEAFESGNSTIDSQHKELFELANALIESALAASFAGGRIDAPLGRLIDHIRQHFTDEEEILASIGYDQLAEHHEAHLRLLQRAEALRFSVARGETTPWAIVEFLANDVVARHLMGVDRAFFELFERAPSAPA